MLKTLAIIMAAISYATAYPLFKQCDPKWGKDQLGTS
jgi:hypothetical protein